MYSKKLTIIARGLQLRRPAEKNGWGGGCAQKAPLFQAMFRIIDSKYLLLGLIYLMGVGLHNLCTEHRNLVGYLLTDQLKKLAHHPILAKFKPCKEYQDSFSLCYFLLLK